MLCFALWKLSKRDVLVEQEYPGSYTCIARISLVASIAHRLDVNCAPCVVHPIAEINASPCSRQRIRSRSINWSINQDCNAPWQPTYSARFCAWSSSASMINALTQLLRKKPGLIKISNLKRPMPGSEFSYYYFSLYIRGRWPPIPPHPPYGSHFDYPSSCRLHKSRIANNFLNAWRHTKNRFEIKMANQNSYKLTKRLTVLWITRGNLLKMREFG